MNSRHIQRECMTSRFWYAGWYTFIQSRHPKRTLSKNIMPNILQTNCPQTVIGPNPCSSSLPNSTYNKNPHPKTPLLTKTSKSNRKFIAYTLTEWFQLRSGIRTRLSMLLRLLGNSHKFMGSLRSGNIVFVKTKESRSRSGSMRTLWVILLLKLLSRRKTWLLIWLPCWSVESKK